MKIQKISKASGEFAIKGEDINDGDTVVIKSEGEWIEGQYGEQFVIKVETKNGEKNVNFNRTTLNILHDEYGDETSEWIGKEVVIKTQKKVIGGRKVEVYYFVTPEWEFNEYGELEKIIQ